MITTTNVSIRPASQQDRIQLASLIQFEPYVHRHLDWRPPLDWLGHQPFLVAERRGNLVAALACPADPPEVAWIRTFVSAGQIPAGRSWQSLWQEAQVQLLSQDHLNVAAIPLYRWFRSLLEKSQFEHTHNVVLLEWAGRDRPPEPACSAAEIRSMAEADLPTVAQVDHAAFRSIWRNSPESLALAFNQAVCATVAEDDQGIVGYQISTPSPFGWHLARLAVLPRAQRRGIALALVRHMQASLYQRGAYRVTVNTQNDNEGSLRLYKKAGFHRTGEEYPVYQFSIN